MSEALSPEHPVSNTAVSAAAAKLSIYCFFVIFFSQCSICSPSKRTAFTFQKHSFYPPKGLLSSSKSIAFIFRLFSFSFFLFLENTSTPPQTFWNADVQGVSCGEVFSQHLPIRFPFIKGVPAHLGRCGGVFVSICIFSTGTPFLSPFSQGIRSRVSILFFFFHFPFIYSPLRGS